MQASSSNKVHLLVSLDLVEFLGSLPAQHLNSTVLVEIHQVGSGALQLNGLIREEDRVHQHSIILEVIGSANVRQFQGLAEAEREQETE